MPYHARPRKRAGPHQHHTVSLEIRPIGTSGRPDLNIQYTASDCHRTLDTGVNGLSMARDLTVQGIGPVRVPDLAPRDPSGEAARLTRGWRHHGGLNMLKRAEYTVLVRSVALIVLAAGLNCHSRLW
jgi:hypothetical protein